MNHLVGERLSIITPKAQTTRHRILGIVNTADYQIVYSDTPGVVRSAYALHDSMMAFVTNALRDADVFLLVIEVGQRELNQSQILSSIQSSKIPVVLAVNKIDQSNQKKVESAVDYWQKSIPRAAIFPISALEGFNVEPLFDKIVELLPESPPYFDKEELTDKPLRFFVAELIREQLFMLYRKEIPYSSEVEITRYKDQGSIVYIDATIYVERQSQKGILIGYQGKALKKVGTEARKKIEIFLDKQIFLQLYVKVDKDWRSKKQRLKYYGYNS
jgi:GTP-binding protein Era